MRNFTLVAYEKYRHARSFNFFLFTDEGLFTEVFDGIEFETSFEYFGREIILVKERTSYQFDRNIYSMDEINWWINNHKKMLVVSCSFIHRSAIQISTLITNRRPKALGRRASSVTRSLLTEVLGDLRDYAILNIPCVSNRYNWML